MDRYIDRHAKESLIDPTSFLLGARVVLFSSSSDTVVLQPVMRAAATQVLSHPRCGISSPASPLLSPLLSSPPDPSALAPPCIDLSAVSPSDSPRPYPNPNPNPNPNPSQASQSMLDAAEASLRATLVELRLRASILRKPRAVGMIPGGREGKERQPGGSGSSTLSRESLDEAVLRLQQELRDVCERLNAAAEGGAPSPSPSP